MSHAHAQPMTQIDDPEPAATWTVSMVGAILIAFTVVAVACVYFIAAEHEVDVKVIDPPDAVPAALKAEQQSLLSSYGTYTMTDAAGHEHRTIRIPVAKAMELLVAEGVVPAKAAAPAVPVAPVPAVDPPVVPAPAVPAPTAPAPTATP